MRAYRAITWDHPRGYNALAAAAAQLQPERDNLSIAWDRHPLEAFESHPIADLCERYDLLVLDHPHIGEAVGCDALRPVEEIFDANFVTDVAGGSVGPSFSSYRYEGRHWALPLDAATQVMAMRADLLPSHPPDTWDEVVALSRMTGAVALSLAGPHALLTFLSLATAFGEAPARRDPDVLISIENGRRVLELMIAIVDRSPPSVAELNPIDLSRHMAANDDLILCPLIYGYVNYAAPTRGAPIQFANAPRASAGGRRGSTLGGTGIGISRHCQVTAPLQRHLAWLLSEDAQIGFIPQHDGQPSLRTAWLDPALNQRSGEFYLSTVETIETAYVRPRHLGYIGFQTQGAALLREAVAARNAGISVIEKLQELYRLSRAHGGDI